MPMTPEQIDEALKSDEAQTAIKTAVDAQVEGLKNKNTELLGKLKIASEEKTDVIKRLEDLEAEKTKNVEQGLMKAGDFDKLKAQIEERHTKELKDRDGKIEGLNGQLKKHVLGEGLTAALVKANVAKPLMDAAKALITTNYQGEVGDNDGSPFAKFDGKAVEEFVTGWAQSDQGKHFVSADSNSGGGSNGANGKGKVETGKTITRAEFDGLDQASRMAKSKEGFKVVDAT